MGTTDQFEEDLFLALFTHVTLPHVGDTTGMGVPATVGSVDVSLHGSAMDDLDTSNATNAVIYTNYVIKSVARAGAQWTISAGTCNNTNAITFATCGVTGDTATDYGLALNTGNTFLQFYGTLNSPLVINQDLTPEFAATQLALTLD